ncbi:MAG: class I SAM-dependent methyltransferase [Planctomycetaceae bacterium]
MPNTREEVACGQALYTRRVLAWYDLFVLGLSCRLAWKCPAARLLELYNRNVSANHLEAGVGTGYFLDRCRFPDSPGQLVLLDLNPNCLKATSVRVARFNPTAVRASVLEPLPVGSRTFDSVGMNFVLHCLPGSLPEKSIAFDHLQAVMNPGAVLFGTTLLGQGVRANWLARRLMRLYNDRRAFCNLSDSRDELERQLQKRFSDCAVEVVGCAALFTARQPPAA